MLPEIEKLLILQERDQTLRSLRQELKIAPAERLALEQKLAAAGKQLESLKLKAQEIEVERKKLEIDAESKRAAIGKYKGQQLQTRKNEEFQALANEIRHAEEDIVKIEDREIELMEANEVMKREIADARKAFEAMEAQLKAQLAEVDSRRAAMENRLRDLESTRPQLAEGLDDSLLRLYERLLTSKGDAAVVAVEHDVCRGCHMKIPTQTILRARTGKNVVQCDLCGRMLYLQV